jgi:hypothetical protein
MLTWKSFSSKQAEFRKKNERGSQFLLGPGKQPKKFEENVCH